MRLLTTIFLLITLPVQAANWYLDNAATGSRSGTSWANAWTNPAAVVWGASGVTAGDTLYISGGSTSKTYTNGFTVGADGTAANRINIRVGQDAGHNGKVIFDGSAWGQACTELGVMTMHRTFITVNGEVSGQTNLYLVNWRNLTNKNVARGVYGNTGSDITVAYCVISNVNTCIHISGGTNLVVAYCDLLAYGDSVIAFNVCHLNATTDGWDSQLVFSNRLTSMWNPYDPAYGQDPAHPWGGPDGIQCQDGLTAFRNLFRVLKTSETNISNHTDFLQSNGHHTKLYQNEIVNIGDSGFSPSPWTAGYGIMDIRIYNNIFRMTDLFDPGPEYVRMYNTAGLPGFTNVLILNNLFVDNTNAGYVLGMIDELGTSPGTNNWVANNLFIGMAGTNVFQQVIKWTSLGATPSAWHFTNNVYTSRYGIGATKLSFLGTNYYIPDWKANYDPSTGTNVPAFAQYTPFAADNDFHLLASDTNALGKGLNFSDYFTNDYDGVTRGATWSIGPYEYAPGTAPSISDQTGNLTVYPGQNATFTVTATGSAPLTYQWKLNGTAITGATTSSYSTNRVHLTARGNVYTVGVTNASGGVLSTNATLTVTIPIKDLPCAYGTASVEPRAVRGYSVVDTNAGNIFLVWPTNELGNLVVISRRIYTNNPTYWTTWTDVYTNATYPMTEGEWVDTTATTGVHYEYVIREDTTNQMCGAESTRSYMSYQYVNTGRELPLRDQRGSVVLLVESGLAASIASELTTFTNDLVADGYKVFRHNVAAVEVTNASWAASVTSTKALVVSDYNTAPETNWTLFILGHVPVPYSGDNSPGSHSDNTGAHPCDWYYADMTGSWTDSTVTDNSADFAWTHNTPGDGKFDQSYLPAQPTMRVGRVDLRNMPAFGKTEVQLVQQYLNRDHLWRTKQFTVRDRALIMTNGEPIEDHSQFTSLFGADTNYDVISWLQAATNPASSYLIASSDGWGHYEQDGLIGYTTNFAAGSLYAAFTSMHGSYYGDWDSAMITNDVMWAPLCSTGCVLSTWYHEIAAPMEPSMMGEPISQDFYFSAANYFPDFAKRYITSSYWYTNGTVNQVAARISSYAGFCGDPTLRLRVVAPPSSVTVSTNAANLVISWSPASDVGIQGYHVYRATTGSFNSPTRLTTNPTTSPYTDVGAASGSYTYWVRTVKLEDSPQRSYYNASQGIFASGGGGSPPQPPEESGGSLTNGPTIRATGVHVGAIKRPDGN